MANDPHWNSVVLAMHMDDAGLTDLKGHAVTLNGNVVRSATQSKFGGYSAYFDGTGGYLTIPTSSDFNFGSGDFTVEFFVFFSSVTTSGLVAFGPSGYVPVLVYNVGSEIRFYSGSATASSWDVASAAVIKSGASTGQWYHIAIARSGSSIRLFCDGVLSTTVTSSATLANAITTIRLGDWAGANYLNGYIDDLRITKGVARYTATFPVPTEAFPNTPSQLIGTVVDMNSNPASRPVIAFPRNRADASCATISDAETGAFTLPAYDASTHTVVALPVEGDPYWNNVVLAMHMDGTNGSTTFTDAKGRTVTAYGNAQISTAQSKFGGASAYFDGTGDYLYSPTPIITTTGVVFTVGFYARVTSTTEQAFVAQYDNVVGRFSIYIYNNVLCAFIGSTVSLNMVGTTTFPTGQFVHVAFSRDKDSVCRLFLNGALEAIGASSQVIVSAPMSIGGQYSTALGLQHPMTGYIDDLRITNGVARYIHNFTPPSSAFPHAVAGSSENALIFDNITPV